MGEIRFVGTGETRGYPYPVCKKILLCKREGGYKNECLQVVEFLVLYH